MNRCPSCGTVGPPWSRAHSRTCDGYVPATVVLPSIFDAATPEPAATP